MKYAYAFMILSLQLPADVISRLSLVLRPKLTSLRPSLRIDVPPPLKMPRLVPIYHIS